MKSRVASPLSAIAVAAVATALLTAPGVAVAQTSDQACEITGGTLTWGVKESFRAYISGSIANGTWETSDGADYATPEFVWTNGTGTYDPATGTGSVSFKGTLHFTGHDGVLDLTLANPTIEFEGGDSAALLLDARSNDMKGAVAVDTQQEWVGKIDLGAAPSLANGAIELAKLPTTLTNSGATAFAGFYEAGAELDPLNLALVASGCVGTSAPVAAAESAQPSETAAAGPAAGAEQGIPWWPIIIGGAALIIIGATGGVLIGGRRARTGGAGSAPQSDAEGES